MLAPSSPEASVVERDLMGAFGGVASGGSKVKRSFSMKGENMALTLQTWHHRPVHLFVPKAAYIVTAGTHHKGHYFRGDERLRLLQGELFATAEAYDWKLQAWAIFSNHYHFIAHAPSDATSLRRMLQRLHSATARAVNRMDNTPGRQVWFQFWDTCLTHESSYARLNYVHHNAVHHGLVPIADQYEFCSAAWFAANADSAFYKRACSYGYARLEIEDGF